MAAAVAFCGIYSDQLVRSHPFGNCVDALRKPVRTGIRQPVDRYEIWLSIRDTRGPHCTEY